MVQQSISCVGPVTDQTLTGTNDDERSINKSMKGTS
jgi:hypothetical protein